MGASEIKDLISTTPGAYKNWATENVTPVWVAGNKGAPEYYTTKYIQKLLRLFLEIQNNQANPLQDLTMKISHQIWDEWCPAHCLFYILFSCRCPELLKPLVKQR